MIARLSPHKCLACTWTRAPGWLCPPRSATANCHLVVCVWVRGAVHPDHAIIMLLTHDPTTCININMHRPAHCHLHALLSPRQSDARPRRALSFMHNDASRILGRPTWSAECSRHPVASQCRTDPLRGPLSAHRTAALAGSADNAGWLYNGGGSNARGSHAQHDIEKTENQQQSRALSDFVLYRGCEIENHLCDATIVKDLAQRDLQLVTV